MRADSTETGGSWPIPDSELFDLQWPPPTRLAGNQQAGRGLDPYYEIFPRAGQFQRGATYEEALNATATSGMVRLPAAYRPDRAWSVPELLKSRGRNVALRLLGVLISYGAVTNNQAAVFTGDTGVADPRSKVIASLFLAGLIRIESPYVGGGLADAGRAATLYQLGEHKRVSALRHVLSSTEWLSVTGGRELPTVSANPRHDAVAAEVALRAAVSLPVAAVLGAHHARFVDLLDPRGWPKLPTGGPDLVIVRADGLRIAIEVTATIGKGFERKVDRWAQVLAHEPKSSRLVVLFLAAPAWYTQYAKGPGWPENVIKDTVQSAVSRWGSSARSKMWVANWRNWFPAPWRAHVSFRNLAAVRAVGVDHWQAGLLLDTEQVPADLDTGLDRFVEAATLLGQTPVCLTEGAHPERLAARLLTEAIDPPVALPPHRKRSAGRRVGPGQGAAGDAQFPARLLGPTSRSDGSGVSIPETGPPMAADRPRARDMRQVRAARSAADVLRSEFLIALHDRTITPKDVIASAVLPEFAALRTLKLRKVYLEAGMSPARWRRVRDLTLAVLDIDMREGEMTIGWLHDPRTGGRRHYAFADALRDRDQPPWPGFPWQATT